MSITQKKLIRMKQNNQGATLIENIIAIFAISLVFVGLVKIYYMSAYQTNMSRHKVAAANLAQASLENISNTGYANIDTSIYPVNQNVVIDPGLTDGTTDDLNGTMTTAFANYETNQGYKFTVTVSWNEPVEDQTRALSEVTELLLTDYE